PREIGQLPFPWLARRCRTSRRTPLHRRGRTSRRTPLHRRGHTSRRTPLHRRCRTSRRTPLHGGGRTSRRTPLHGGGLPVKSFEALFFALSALLTVGGAVATIGSRRPIRSAMGLLVTILGICGCYLLLGAELLATVQLIVYAGAVVVLFIFVVMLLGPAAVSGTDKASAIPRYVGATVFGVGALGAGVLMRQLASERLTSTKLVKLPDGFGGIEAVGRELFTTYVIPFELTGALLLVAVVGAMAVARGKQADPTRPNAPVNPHLADPHLADSDPSDAQSAINVKAPTGEPSSAATAANAAKPPTGEPSSAATAAKPPTGEPISAASAANAANAAKPGDGH
ncbi:MAG: hypothetical protein EXR75_12095, partial [Myxococcales bacterium]|nr:hypothetical protein [Myxococcales bacterium]